ncbi:hypothetical protein Vi05172_g12143 [Venturia inaequalis]|nr:hypothetical protein Vi05172_g12143 [Venturia inaequalis]
MQFTAHLIAAVMAFATIADADVGCGKGYCPCMRAPHADFDSCKLGFCANTHPRGSYIPDCFPDAPGKKST